MNSIGPRSCYDEGKRCAETLFFDYYRRYNLAIKGRPDFQYLRPENAPRRRSRRQNFVVQALRGEDITVYGSEQRRGASATSTTWWTA